LERLIRRFSYDAVEGFIPEADRKLMINIRKRRERAKRHRASADEVGVGSEQTYISAPAIMTKSGSRQKEFEDVIRDSDSELDSDNEDLDEYLPELLRDGTAQKVLTCYFICTHLLQRFLIHLTTLDWER